LRDSESATIKVTGLPDDVDLARIAWSARGATLA
jgi:hypothetical protein